MEKVEPTGFAEGAITFITPEVYLHCSNNPVNRADDQGTFWDTFLDIASTAYSLWNVMKNPKEPSNWVALGADLLCMAVPGMTGGGTIVRASKYADEAVQGVKSSYHAVNSADAAYDAGNAVGSAASNPALCFTEGTLILTEDRLKEIESVKEGDMVWSENPETGEKALKEVVQTFVNKTDELVHIYIEHEEISATPEHPFYVRGKGWTGAIDLRAGDILVLQDGGYVIVEKVQHEILERPVTVCNFEVEDFHTYYVGEDSILVHNTCYQYSSRGSTAKLEPQNLLEQLALEEVISNQQGNPLKFKMNDTRWPASEGWVKMSQNINTSKGNVEIHYVYNTTMKVFDDFKIKKGL